MYTCHQKIKILYRRYSIFRTIILEIIVSVRSCINFLYTSLDIFIPQKSVFSDVAILSTSIILL